MSGLSKKVGYHLPDTELRTVMEHVACLESKIDSVNNVLQADTKQKEEV